ncbi:hypothetical protein [Clostridium sp.]|uniref:hypothetical protein n=1 Tax=Clostridium sp. TaxID=1506 RepID=UPI0025BCBA25|nr:hypothetical protein [Clostridium sp.]MCI9304417.1 hypothetical protein [Clostridium sp.]
MKFSKLTKKILCSFALGFTILSSFNAINAHAATVTCKTGHLVIKSAPSNSSSTAGYFYPNEYFYTSSSYNNGRDTFFEYRAYSGNMRYVNYKQTTGTYEVTN